MPAALVQRFFQNHLPTHSTLNPNPQILNPEAYTLKQQQGRAEWQQPDKDSQPDTSMLESRRREQALRYAA